MRNLRNMQLWTGILVATLMIFIVVFAYLARRPLCIDSKLVERIDSQSGSQVSTAFRCSLHKHVPYDSTLANLMKDLDRDLHRLERYFEWLGPLQKRISLIIVQGEGHFFELNDHEIKISESVLRSQGQLEKAFFRIWFRERTNAMVQSQSLIEESLTDFLYYTFSGDLDIQVPEKGLYLNQDIEAKWPQVLTNLKGYCQSLWSRLEDQRICGDMGSFSNDEILPQTLRPLITQALIESYQNLETQNRIDFLKSLSVSLSQLEVNEKDFGMSSFNSPQQNYHQAVSQLENWTYFLNQMKSKSLVSQKLSTLFEISLRRRGFDQNSPYPSLDILIFTDGLRENQKQDVLKQIENAKEDFIGIESKDSIQMSFLSEPLNLKLLGEVRAKTGVLFHCGSLDSYRMRSLSRKVQKLLYVNSCGDQKITLSGFLKNGVTSFARQNPKLKFAQLHLPSLMMALPKMSGQNPIYLIGANKKDSLKALGWREPSFDESIQAYRAQSAIEIVDWFRL